MQKKSAGTLADGTVFLDADGVRPLNVANTDNRILANAVRMVIEPRVSPRIIFLQRGFPAGRSLLANLLDVEEAMLHQALADTNSCAILFDFKAAFPSLEHGLLRALLRHLNWPAWTLLLRCGRMQTSRF